MATSERAIPPRKDSPAANSSIDSGRSPSSAHTPFLHNLSQRFRKGSNASSNTSDSHNPSIDKNDGTTVPTAKQTERARADASRAAKRYLMTIVRNDWEYPPPAETEKDLYRRPDGKEPTSWRLRDDGSEDELDHAHPTSPTKRRSKSNPYRFENPDAVADYVRERQVKRRKVLYEQMEWNHGLNHWVRQRDAWTGAVWTPPTTVVRSESAEVREAKQNTLGLILEKGDITDSGTTTATSVSSGTEDHPPAANQQSSRPERYTQSPDRLHSPFNSNSNPDTSTSSLEHTTTLTTATTGRTTTGSSAAKPISTTATADKHPPPDDTRPGPYIPMHAPLFPSDNVLRSRISAPAYPAIYSKIVVQCLTPNIPIPLPDMVRALVAGWKEEGNWPPGAGQALAQAQAAKAKRAEGGAFARWRRERGKAKRGQDGVVDVGKVVEGAVVGGEQQDRETEAPGGSGHRVRRSIGLVVKKAFGMEDEGERRGSEVGLTMGFEEDDEAVEGGERPGLGDEDRRLNSGLLEGDAKA